MKDISHFKSEKEPLSRGYNMMGGKIDMDMSTINIQAGPFNKTILFIKEEIEPVKGFLALLGKEIKVKQETKTYIEPQVEKN